MLAAWFLIISFLVLPANAEAALLPECNPVPNCLDSCIDSCNATGDCIAQCTKQCGGTKANLPACSATHLLELLVNIYNFLLGLAALIAMLFIVFGGVRMLYYSYMEDSASELEAAKLTIRRAVGGFTIIATAYLMVNTVLLMLGLSDASLVGKILSEDLGLFRKP